MRESCYNSTCSNCGLGQYELDFVDLVIGLSGTQHRRSAGDERQSQDFAQLGALVWLHELFYWFICTILFLVVMREPIPSMASRLPIWAWFGGVFGAIYIALSIYLIPQIGAATFMALLITGQMMGSVAFDHFGVLGLAERPVDLWRVVGVALLIIGVVLIQR